MDIEGAEYDVFENRVETLRNVRFLVMEIHAIPSKDPATIIISMLKQGFDLSRVQ
jgi:hypothetical protein